MKYDNEVEVEMNLIMGAARQESAKDTENKQFLKVVTKYALTAIGGAVLLGVVYVGGKSGLERRSDEA